MSRSGRYEKQLQGYKSFVPAPLPPNPPLVIDGELQELLQQATRQLARLNGLADALPNVDLFVAMYVKKEALLSAQIEGTQASLDNVLNFEQGAISENINDVEEVVNYIHALNYGLERLDTIPMSIRLLKELHELLMQGVRGAHKAPGEFKKLQNWIGSAGGTIQDAIFVPPSPQDTVTAMDQLEAYMHSELPLSPLIDCALIHYQFETIHPFLDGNGRLGRLLITFYLLLKKELDKPLLYLSYYLKKNRQEYYDRLNMVRNTGDYEQWIRFFLKGVVLTVQDAIEQTKKIIELKERHKKLLWEKKISSPLAILFLDQLFYTPLFSVNDVQQTFTISYQAAANIVGQFESAGIIAESTGKKRDKRYVYTEYMAILSKGTKPL